MSGRSNVHSWLFSNNPNKQLCRSRDTMLLARRQLLNDHLDGLYTQAELQVKLQELRDDNN